ncbi:MAG: hypothetical protein IKL83_02145 [Muribaculaceae bacterium]|nr:hypothetical protein [Muribaculaceae bacterium]
MKHIVILLIAFLSSSFCSSATTYPTPNGSTYEIPDNEEYICTVKGWNSANGEYATIRIYLRHSTCDDIYIGREVNERGVSSLYGVVKLVTNPNYQNRYKYYVKTGLIGAFFFNSDKLNRKYVREW